MRSRVLVSSFLLLTLLALELGAKTPPGINSPRGYLFEPVAFLPGPAPGPEGGQMDWYFWAPSINNSGEIAFDSGITVPETGGEGVYVQRHGQIYQIARSGEEAPGGGTFGWLGAQSIIAINQPGEVCFAFSLDPPFDISAPSGTNVGLYRCSNETGELSAVVVPDVTPAPGGGTFQGAYLQIGLNNRGDVVFGGIVPTENGIHVPEQEYMGLGMGIFKADKKGRITSVVSPGDPAPGGSTFDFAENPWNNDSGDVAFGAHVVGDDIIDFGVPQASRIFSAESIYVKKAATGQILSIAHQGAPAPGGGTYRLAFGPVINNSGQIVFIGDLTPSPDVAMALGVFLYTGGMTIPVARPGDAMPGGGHLANASFYVFNYQVNNAGDVAFNGTLDTTDAEGAHDHGLYVWSRGYLRLVARTGTVVPGVGTIAHLAGPIYPDWYGDLCVSYVSFNDRGQVLFQATLTDGRGVLLVATPHA